MFPRSPKNIQPNLFHSQPRLLWAFVAPNKSDPLPAVIIHDYLCDKREFKKADDYFEEVLTLLSVNLTLVVILVSGVRVWHKIAYTKNNYDRIWYKYYKYFKKKIRQLLK